MILTFKTGQLLYNLPIDKLQKKENNETRASFYLSFIALTKPQWKLHQLHEFFIV